MMRKATKKNANTAALESYIKAQVARVVVAVV